MSGSSGGNAISRPRTVRGTIDQDLAPLAATGLR
jgi:hypothetical protein